MGDYRISREQFIASGKRVQELERENAELRAALETVKTVSIRCGYGDQEYWKVIQAALAKAEGGDEREDDAVSVYGAKSIASVGSAVYDRVDGEYTTRHMEGISAVGYISKWIRPNRCIVHIFSPDVADSFNAE